MIQFAKLTSLRRHKEILVTTHLVGVKRSEGGLFSTSQSGFPSLYYPLHHLTPLLPPYSQYYCTSNETYLASVTGEKWSFYSTVDAIVVHCCNTCIIHRRHSHLNETGVCASTYPARKTHGLVTSLEKFGCVIIRNAGLKHPCVSMAEEFERAGK